ncbi:cell division topological specificity factor MinE [Sulfurospirillum arcachonense]|uniref:cell division topological specificity factor MinE n=1 Tax=Sulfurospirillum arcachonense TaxID=57666 RepID=UPI00046A8331|nr:cell division topological specificity factor MinE [Sulfurospirillum arcachonense]
MSLLSKLFGKKQSSASVAKDRLTIMLAHERVDCKLPYLDDLRNDLIEVIKKYTSVDDVKITTHNNQSVDMLEVEILLGKK